MIRRLGVSAAALGVLGARSSRAQTSSGPSDADIVNFALNLEYLEAEFYTIATLGLRIEDAGVDTFGTGTPGQTTGGQKVGLSDSDGLARSVALEIGADERAHCLFLRDTLSLMGVIPVAKPAINLNALGIGFASPTEFLTLARAFEDVGVTAYAAAAPLIKNKQILGAAARIAETEAEHAGNIRRQVARNGIPTTPLDGVDIIPPPSGTNLFSVDKNGLTQVRTPGQVLFIVYGMKANAASGGFFPNGVNGAINTSSPAAVAPPSGT